MDGCWLAASYAEEARNKMRANFEMKSQACLAGVNMMPVIKLLVGNKCEIANKKVDRLIM